VKLRVEAELPEEIGVAQRKENLAVKFASEVYLPLDSVGEAQANRVVLYKTGGNDARRHGSLQRWNRKQRPALTGKRPIREEFLLMHFTPLLNQPQGTSRKLTSNYAACDLHRDFKFAVHRVKVRRLMIAIKHGDHDAEKSRYFGHHGTLHTLGGVFNVAADLPTCGV
jgi:hypothetical protein